MKVPVWSTNIKTTVISFKVKIRLTYKPAKILPLFTWPDIKPVVFNQFPFMPKYCFWMLLIKENLPRKFINCMALMLVNIHFTLLLLFTVFVYIAPISVKNGSKRAGFSPNELTTIHREANSHAPAHPFSCLASTTLIKFSLNGFICSELKKRVKNKNPQISRFFCILLRSSWRTPMYRSVISGSLWLSISIRATTLLCFR